MKSAMNTVNTDLYYEAENPWQAAKDFPPRDSWERTLPASSVPWVSNTLHAGCVRSQGRNLHVLCVSAVRFSLVAAMRICVHRWFRPYFISGPRRVNESCEDPCPAAA